MTIRAGAVPQAIRPGGAALPTAERSELGGELRRVVYGGEESVRHESGGRLNERQSPGRREEAGRPGEKNGKVKQDADEGVPVVADLKQLDAEGAISLRAGSERHAFDKTPRQDFHPQQGHKKNRYKGSQDRAQPTPCPSVPHS